VHGSGRHCGTRHADRWWFGFFAGFGISGNGIVKAPLDPDLTNPTPEADKNERPKSCGDRPTVSVIMANYNGDAYLADAIASVQRQSLHHLELIVSDDASTDNSMRIVTRFVAGDPRIRCIKSDRNGGPAAARNRALAVAQGEWIAIMDSDDLMHPDRLATLVEAGRRDGADIVADDLIIFDSEKAAPSRRLLTGHWGEGPFWVDIVDYIRLNRFGRPGPALGYLKPLFRASVLTQPMGRYDETLWVAEDYYLVLGLLYAGKRLRIYPQPLYFYRQHAASVSRRLSEGELRLIIGADIRFLDRLHADRRVANAVRARMRSTETVIAFFKLLSALKARNWIGAVVIALRRPQIAALLRHPIGARLRRFVPFRASSTSAANTPAAETSKPCHDR
jgi:succinoglycan biosynthesis protein ExoO